MLLIQDLICGIKTNSKEGIDRITVVKKYQLGMKSGEIEVEKIKAKLEDKRVIRRRSDLHILTTAQRKKEPCGTPGKTGQFGPIIE